MNSKWVSVKDRLPTDGEYVLVCEKGNLQDEIFIGDGVAFALYSSCYKGCCKADFDIKSPNWFSEITHWQSLPKVLKQ